MSSRALVLDRIRRALSDVPATDPPYDRAVPRAYAREHGARTQAQNVDLLAENLADYRAHVHRCGPEGLTALLTRLLDERDARRVLLPAGLPRELLDGAAVEVLDDGTGLTAQELDGVDSVVTGCAVAVAETGTLVLDAGADQGTRRGTLVPDHHICLVRVPDQVVASVPQALELLDPARPLTWISGPSATSDIELDRVEGVHGPRRLDVVLIEG
ncbi:LutC/YkgG family protein [Streptomyces mesophilus]|uniref:LutC/YkgG family protein n=1 Tax=Streptomyces mesophilus TaxID=1775132 RepID=UPI0033276B02